MHSYRLLKRGFEIAALVGLLCWQGAEARAALEIPAFTAYLEPDGLGARVSERSGITGWKNPGQAILWFGEFKTNGPVEVSVQLQLPASATTQLRLTVAEQSRTVEVEGAGTNLIVARFGRFVLPQPGYHSFKLTSKAGSNASGNVKALLLDGAAIDKAHFNLKPRRNAASVHLGYPVPAGTNVAAFYCEMIGLEDPVHTYYMACGWHRGYFGMQVNSPTERRIIFSVWDSGNEAIDRKKVSDDNRVKLMGKGDGVYTGDFGNEGTGGHSHLKYAWKTGDVQRFVFTAQPTNQTFTIYSGHYFHPERKEWMLISSWKAPRDGSWMKGLYSFSENFSGQNGHLRRKALFGNQWIRTDAGQWIELTTAKFTHDSTGRADRLDRFMGVEKGWFFLSQGGFVEGFTKSGQLLDRPAIQTPPDLSSVFPAGP